MSNRNHVEIWLVIPARYGSVRFGGKVLARETGKFLIQHTYEQACLSRLSKRVLIAADDERICSAAGSFGAECVLTSPEHTSGTDRIAEAVADKNVELVINVQADEPEIDPADIDSLAELLIENPNVPMATLAAEFQSVEQITNGDIVKVVTDSRSRAIYFSRAAIPYDRGRADLGRGATSESSAKRQLDVKLYLRHIGIYAYRKEFLLEFTRLPHGRLERIEKLEQLRAIENGFEILTGKVKHIPSGIDTPEQYAEFVKRYKKSHRAHRDHRDI